VISISDNIAHLKEQIAACARRASRHSDEITLMAVTKTVSPDRIREAYDAGLRVFGENRIQEFAGKSGLLNDLPNAEWHMIGHLQSNKAAKAAELFNSVDSIDSLRLAQKVNAAAAALGKKLPVLIEINIGGEPAKSGVLPDSTELAELLSAAPDLPSLGLLGLMSVPPYDDNPEKSRPHFRRLRQLFEQIISRKLPDINFEVLSMGMSHDFEVAIEEGSTCVRIGTAIFGERPPLRAKV
jgi:pyridoxal phosphate enzyme (YggS family)